MKKLFLAAPLAVTFALLMSFTATLQAADTPNNNVDLDKMALEFEKRAEEDAKNELKRLVNDDTLKKDLAAARGSQGDNQAAAPTSELCAS
ncbi:MAG: hypothetical protein D3922_15365, partial [Candidatus Electrothrix sp. AR1]|nr:hypothetical protein [Candidatus Electrothrix sp. AR1]